MMNFDPTQPLLDLTVHDGKPVFHIEQPNLGCVCDEGRINGDWLYRREPQCTCPAATSDFVNSLHSLDCDSVPCPFCALEPPRG